MSSSFPCNLKEISNVIQDYPKEIAVWDQKFDVPEIDNSNLGGLQKNRILGLFLWSKEKEKELVSTNEIQKDFVKFYNSDISRSNISTYLNQLTKDGVLGKEKKGKTVEYQMVHNPPLEMKRFY